MRNDRQVHGHAVQARDHRKLVIGPCSWMACGRMDGRCPGAARPWMAPSNPTGAQVAAGRPARIASGCRWVTFSARESPGDPPLDVTPLWPGRGRRQRAAAHRRRAELRAADPRGRAVDDPAGRAHLGPMTFAARAPGLRLRVALDPRRAARADPVQCNGAPRSRSDPSRARIRPAGEVWSAIVYSDE